MVKPALHWQIPEWICVQTVGFPIPQVSEQFVERFVVAPVPRILKRNVEEMVR